jgi:hypothetical protein
MLNYFILTILAYLIILWSFYFYSLIDLKLGLAKVSHKSFFILIILAVIWFTLSVLVYFYFPYLVTDIYLGLIFLIFLFVPLFFILKKKLNNLRSLILGLLITIIILFLQYFFPTILLKNLIIIFGLGALTTIIHKSKWFKTGHYILISILASLYDYWLVVKTGLVDTIEASVVSPFALILEAGPKSLGAGDLTFIVIFGLIFYSLAGRRKAWLYSTFLTIPLIVLGYFNVQGILSGSLPYTLYLVPIFLVIYLLLLLKSRVIGKIEEDNIS